MPEDLHPHPFHELLRPYLDGAQQIPPPLYDQLSVYLEVLRKWNARTNLTSIREAEEIVLRHFGESLFAARHLGECATLLDFGSGAGFPGLPIQLFRPELQVTLAESQNKKAAFLREVIRVLGLKTEVWAGRVEALPAERVFECVTLRAVDRMDEAIVTGAARASRKMMLLLSGQQPSPVVAGFYSDNAVISIPGQASAKLVILRR